MTETSDQATELGYGRERHRVVTYDGISDEFDDIGKVSIEEKNLRLSFADLGVD